MALKDDQLKAKDQLILLLQRQLYGRRSEKQLPSYNEAIPTLFDSLEGEETLAEERDSPNLKSIETQINSEAEERRKRVQLARKDNSVKRTYKLPLDLRREETVIKPEGVDTTNLIKIGEDISEILMLRKSEFWVKRIIRPVYKAKEDKDSTTTTIHQAPIAKQVLPGVMVDSSVFSQIIVDKFQHHLPEYRQASRFKSYGIDISTSSINRWVHSLADKLYLLYKLQVESILQSDYIQVDETTLKIADKPGKCRTGYVWAVRDAINKGVFFYYSSGSRTQAIVLSLLRNYRGALQTDGYEAYSIYESKQGVLPLACMAHVRRKFENALATNPEAQIALDFIALLYRLEHNLQEKGADIETIRQERETKAYPILQEMERWMQTTYYKYPPKDKLSEAIKYAFGMWIRVSRYTKDGRFDIDNNAIERAIRPIAIGRKNYLFAKNNKSAEDYSIFYTLIATCIEYKIDPLHYFNTILPKITDETPISELENLLPKNFCN